MRVNDYDKETLRDYFQDKYMETEEFKKNLMYDCGLDYFYDNEDYFLEWLEHNPEFIEWDKDNRSLEKDPYGFYGVSEHDFH